MGIVGTVLVVKRLVRLARASFAVEVWACIWLAMLRMGEVKLGKVDSSRGDWGLRKRRSSGRSPRPLEKAMVFYLRRSRGVSSRILEALAGAPDCSGRWRCKYPGALRPARRRRGLGSSASGNQLEGQRTGKMEHRASALLGELCEVGLRWGHARGARAAEEEPPGGGCTVQCSAWSSRNRAAAGRGAASSNGRPNEQAGRTIDDTIVTYKYTQNRHSSWRAERSGTGAEAWFRESRPARAPAPGSAPPHAPAGTSVIRFSTFEAALSGRALPNSRSLFATSSYVSNARPRQHRLHAHPM